MSIRWRLSVMALQLSLLVTATHHVTGAWVVSETWFFAGLLAVVVNAQLLEPWYPKRLDVLTNSLLAGFLTWTAIGPGPARLGWIGLGTILLFVAAAAATSLVSGSARTAQPASGVRATATISRFASAKFVYSAVFWLANIDYQPSLQADFWTLGGAWALLLFLGHIDWQALWSTFRGLSLPCVPQGMIGPSTLLLSGQSIPHVGFEVRLKADGFEAARGTILTRIRRTSDVWGQIHIHDAARCEALCESPIVEIHVVSPPTAISPTGAVETGSTHRILCFMATRSLEIGSVVQVQLDDHDLLYQVHSAMVEEETVPGGRHLAVRTRATQLGFYEPDTRQVRSYPWTPPLGASVHVAQETGAPADTPLDNTLRLGTLRGTSVPVFVDLAAVRQHHLAILGMTRMGKNTLALRIARALSATSNVTILDQTGEYTAHRGLERYASGHEDRDSGISVYEPNPGEVAADRALGCLQHIVDKASAEYASGQVRSRVLIIDEAHQFIPEPAGLGFNAPGRDSAYKFGLLMMQVRKFGIAIVLISQRTAVVAKSALSQCENIVAFKSLDQTGLDYLEAAAGPEARALVPSLRQGEALALGPSVSADAPVVIRVDPPE